MLCQQRLDAVGTELAPVHVGEQCCCSFPYRFLEPCLERAPSEVVSGVHPLFPAFTDASHVCARPEVDGIPVEAGQLGEAQARLGRDQQQGVIAAAKPCRPIGRGENRLDLGARQEMHLPLVVALARYREHTLDQRAVCRLLEGHEPEEGADGGQTQVARLRAGAALCLKIGQERADERRVQIGRASGPMGHPEPLPVRT